MSACDASWAVDLICKYFKSNTDPVGKTGGWYNEMDPKRTLDDRKRVLDMLLNDAGQTNPADNDKRAESMIPWNQNNDGIVKSFKSNLACGSVVKIAFIKYMGWPGFVKGKQHEPPRRSMAHKNWNGLKYIIKSLDAGKPVRVFLKAKNHHVGIVGYRPLPMAVADTQYEFLVMDPWAGGARTGTETIKYAGKDTKFLGIGKQDGNKIVYDGYDVTDVDGWHPFDAR